MKGIFALPIFILGLAYGSFGQCSFSVNSAYGNSWAELYRPVGLLKIGNAILVVESSNAQIKVLEQSGSSITHISTFGIYGARPGEFRNPQYLAADSLGRIYVSEYGNDRVSVLAFDGRNLSYITSFGSSGNGLGQFRFPAGIAVKGNKVFVAESQNHRIQAFTFEGNNFTPIGFYGGNQGAALNQLNQPAGLSISEDKLIIADKSNSRIVVLKINGNQMEFFRSFGGNGLTNGLFQFPAHVVANGNHLIVSDYGNHRLQVFYFDGNGYAFSEAWGGNGAQLGSFDDPMALYLDQEKNQLLVSEYNNNRIQIVTLNTMLEVDIIGDKAYNAKDTLKLRAQISGDYQTIKWTKDGWLFSESSSKLMVPNVSLMDVGNYKVTVSNACRTITSGAKNVTITRLLQKISGFVLPMDTFLVTDKKFGFTDLRLSSEEYGLYYTSDPEVAVFQNNTVFFKSEGPVTLSFGHLGNIFYLPVSASLELYVKGKEVTSENNQNFQKDDIDVYPNPATTEISIGGDKNKRVRVYNQYGLLIMESENRKVDISSLAIGLYVIEIQIGNRLIFKRISKI